MELTGEQIIAAPRRQVWEALNDPRILSGCIPGCEEVVRRSDTEFEAKVLTKVGPLRARFSGRVEMRDIDAPAGCTLQFEGGAGPVGMARGHSRVTLEEVEGGTLLRYASEATIGGKLGQIGGRLIDASAKKMADDFFRALNDQLAPVAAPSAPTADAAPLLSPPAPPSRRSAAQAPASVGGQGWSGELQRFFWLAVGAGFGGAVGHLLRF